jgi:hypothetical protein
MVHIRDVQTFAGVEPTKAIEAVPGNEADNGGKQWASTK